MMIQFINVVFNSGSNKEISIYFFFDVTFFIIKSGFLIKVSLFPLIAGQANPLADMVLLSLLLYGGWQLIMGFAFVMWRRK